MKSKNLGQTILVFSLLLLNACTFREYLPDYQKGEALSSDEAVAVFRVVNAKSKDYGLFNSLFEQKIIVNIKKTGKNEWIQLKSNGILDDADSSKIYVKRIPSGLYELNDAVTADGSYIYRWTLNLGFLVFPGEVIYIGDIVMSDQESSVWIVNNRAAVRRQLKQLYPELTNKLTNRKVINFSAKTS